MNHRMETEIGTVRDAEAVESVLKAFWERARTAAMLITQLRQDKQSLEERTAGLESEAGRLRAELAEREQDLKRLRAEHAQLVNARGANGSRDTFTAEEREVLKSRVRELLAKINSHL